MQPEATPRRSAISTTAGIRRKLTSMQQISYPVKSRRHPVSCQQPALERVNAGHAVPNDQGMDVVRTLVGLYRFEVHHMAHDGILVRYSVSAQNIP
jgi:hypothetical protein